MARILLVDDDAPPLEALAFQERQPRRKLEQVDPAFDRIETVIGAGHRFRAFRE